MTLYEQITGDLTDEIHAGVLPPGSMLPSIAALRHEYQVSHITALRVYKELVTARIAEKHGRGYRVRQAEIYQNTDDSIATSRKHTIGLFFRPFQEHKDDNYINEINLALETGIIAAQYDYLRTFAIRSFRTRGEGMNDSADTIAANIGSIARRVAGILLDERVPDDALALFLAAHPLPSVLINRESALDLSSVSGDNPGALEELLRNAAHLNYRRIFLCDEGPTSYWNEFTRIAEFKKLSEQHCEMTLGVLPLDYASGDTGDYLCRIQELLAGKTAEKTLFFCNHDRTAKVLCEGLLSIGIIPGRDCGVCGFYGGNWSFGDGKRLASIRFDTAEIGKKAVNLLLNRMKFPWNILPERIRVPGTFIFGDSM